MSNSHFTAPVTETDPELAAALAHEDERQRYQIELIASENIVSRAVLDALGSKFTNKTVEGYPGRRYHGGAKFVDVAERLAIERACQLFGAKYANVQVHSGTQANQAVFVSLLQPGDPVLSMALAAGGHLSHGARPNQSGKWFDIRNYGVHAETGEINYEEVASLAETHRPKLLIAGGSAYPRVIDFERMAAIARNVEATFLVDMAHFAGLVAAGVHPNPVPHADFVTGTTTKTLRGPRGGFILSRHEDVAKRIDAAVFPGVQGSVHLSHVAAKAVCLSEALQPEFAQYGQQVVDNARALAETLMSHQIDVLTGGTDTHLLLINLRPQALTGDEGEARLAAANITCNKNPTPMDSANPAGWTGIRLGVAAATTRGFGTEDMRKLGGIIAELLLADAATTAAMDRVRRLCEQYPTYPH